MASTALVGALTIGIIGGATTAQADEMMSAQERASLEASLEQQRLAALAQPSNMQIQFERAMTAKKLGYTDEAIRVLSMMVDQQPGLARAELELAALYYQSGDYEKAKPHFEAAAASPKASVELKERIAVYLESIDNKLRRSLTTGTLVVGVGFQTNANGGSDDFANTANISEVAEADDFNLFASLGVNHNRKVGESDRTVWENSGNLYGSLQLDVDELNLMYAEVSSGLKFGLANDNPMSLNIKPYVKLGYLFLEDTTYLTSPSAGAVMNMQLGDNMVLGVGYDFTLEMYNNSDTRTRAEDRDGDDHMLTVSLGIAATQQDVLSFQLDAGKKSADRDEWSFDSLGLSARYSHSFAEAIVPGTLAGTLSLGASYYMSEYDAADQNLTAVGLGTIVREDDRFVVDAGAVLPLSDTMGISVGASYTMQDSNVSLYEYDNLRVLAGVAFAL
ncbi:MAG: hypothetical protein ABF335_10600 [Alphaproteobacteria bacterium]